MEQIKGQMTIFDCLEKPGKYPDFKKMDPAAVVDLIGREIGVEFVWNNFFEDWRCSQTKPKRTIEIEFGHYMGTKTPFIGIGMQYSDRGWGSPCDSIDDAIEVFKKRWNWR
jgi:hypothetical protein